MPGIDQERGGVWGLLRQLFGRHRKQVDLQPEQRRLQQLGHFLQRGDLAGARQTLEQRLPADVGFERQVEAVLVGLEQVRRQVGLVEAAVEGQGDADLGADGERLDQRLGRSDEHTSELQSLMRNSYAVLCLKKKNKG